MVKSDADGPASTVAEPERQAEMMAGYSGTPLAKKLGLKGDQRVALFAPPGFRRSLEPLPSGIQWKPRLRAPLDCVVLFARARRAGPCAAVCAVSEVWSGLKFVRRLKDR